MESQYCHIVIYVYDSQYLHLHLVIIKEGQEFTKENKSTIMLISKWIIYWNFINKQQLRTCFTNGWCNLQASSSQIFTLPSPGFSKSLDGFNTNNHAIQIIICIFADYWASTKKLREKRGWFKGRNIPPDINKPITFS